MKKLTAKQAAALKHILKHEGSSPDVRVEWAPGFKTKHGSKPAGLYSVKPNQYGGYKAYGDWPVARYVIEGLVKKGFITATPGGGEGERLKLRSIPKPGHKETPMPKTPTPLPPLSKWKKRTIDGSHAGIGIQVTYTYGNAQIQDEEGSKDWTVTFYTKQGKKYGNWYGGKDLTPADVPGMEHLFKSINTSPTQAQMDAAAAKLGMKGVVAPPPNYVYYLPSAGAARKVANAYLALHPEAFKAPKPKMKVFYGVYGSKKYLAGKAKGSVVYLKIHGGGDTSSPLFAGLDSKGRGKFTLPAPEGKTARDVAREIKKAATAGQTVLGGKVYAIRLKDSKMNKVYNYWTAK